MTFFSVGEDIRGLPSSIPGSPCSILPHTLPCILQDSPTASVQCTHAWYQERQPGSCPLPPHSPFSSSLSMQACHDHGSHYQVQQFYRAPKDKCPLNLFLWSSRSRFSATWFQVFHISALRISHRAARISHAPAGNNHWQAHQFISLMKL